MKTSEEVLAAWTVLSKGGREIEWTSRRETAPDESRGGSATFPVHEKARDETVDSHAQNVVHCLSHLFAHKQDRAC